MEASTVVDEALEAPLRAKLTELEAAEATEEAKVEEARARAAEIIEEADLRRRVITEERKRIDKALKVLRGEPLTAPKPKAKPSRSWTPSDSVISNVREAVRRVAAKSADGGFFFFELQEESPHSDVTTGNALDVLRESNEVRRDAPRNAGERRGMKDYFVLDLILEGEEEESPEERYEEVRDGVPDEVSA